MEEFRNIAYKCSNLLNLDLAEVSKSSEFQCLAFTIAISQIEIFKYVFFYLRHRLPNADSMFLILTVDKW